MSSRRGLGVLLAAGVLVVLGAGPAASHTDLVAATPAELARLSVPPGQVQLRFDRAPAPGARLSVRDGCGRDVTGAVEQRGPTLRATVPDGAAPGAWAVRYTLLSSDDGHVVEGETAFQVAGAADCAAAPAALPAPAAPTEPPASTAAVRWMSAGSLALLGAALVVRRALR